MRRIDAFKIPKKVSDRDQEISSKLITTACVAAQKCVVRLDQSPQKEPVLIYHSHH
jgi:hypothetical protein